MRFLLAGFLGSLFLVGVGLGLRSIGWLPPEGAWFLGAWALLLVLGTLVAASARPSLQVYAPAVLRGPAGSGGVALTFDDGPDPASTLQLLEALERVDARATFFVLADRAEAHPELLRAIASRHEVALHGPSHDPRLVFVSPSVGARALQEASGRIETICGQRPRWYRPPFGVTSPRLAQALAGTPLRMAWCSLRTMDGVGSSPLALRRACGRAVAGDIVLLHEGPRAAREALPVILQDLLSRGLRPVTVSELLEWSP